jgi:two-component system cell cycle sensor histidine kinase/response regulator CckA
VQVQADLTSGVERVAPRVNSRLWIGVLVAGAAAIVVYNLTLAHTNLNAILYLAADALAVAAVFAAILLNHPARPRAWALIGLGMATFMAGDVVWYWLVLVQQVEPTPSVADFFYLAEYPFLAAGVFLLVRTRMERAVALDTLLATASGFVIIWELLVRPYLNSAQGSPLELGIAVAYPVGDVALLAVVARLFFDTDRWSPALRLLAIGLVATLLADVAFLRVSLVDPNADTSLLDDFYLASLFALAAAAFHPSARPQLPTAAGVRLEGGPIRRLLLAGALLLLPATLVLTTALNGSVDVDLPVFMVAWTIVAFLVVLRVEVAISQARQSEVRFRTIFEGSPAGMAIARSGKVILVNSTVRSMFRVDAREDLKAKPLTEYLAPEWRADLIRRVKARQSGVLGSDRFETVGLRADGSTFPLIVGTQDLELPDGRATLGFMMDVSAERAAEETLKDSERRYRELFEGNPHPMWIYDSETLRILAVNDTAVQRFGWSREQFQAMTIADIRPPEDVAALTELLRTNRNALRSMTVRYCHADGSIFWADVTSHEVIWDGRPARLVLAADVTKRRRLEEQLHQAQKMEAVGRLAGGVAHDFNNLLTAISGYAEILRGEFEPDDARVAEVDEILLAGKRAAGLTRQLLSFSRRQVLQPSILNLNESIEELRTMLVRLIGEDVELKTDLDPALGLVRADPGQLTQVLMNLAVNARDAMPDGGTLILATANVQLAASFARAHEGVRPGPHVKLTVMDSGTGMDDETLGHVFEPFFTTKEPGKGTGLGLATVYGIVRQSGGSIDVQSEVGRGSTFTIWLPKAPVGDVEESFEGWGVGPERGHETVLVVEDEVSVLGLAVSVLGRHGYTVLAARGPAEADAVIAGYDGPIDLLLTDVIMPGGTGPDLAARAIDSRPGLRVLLMSGYAKDAFMDRAPADLGATLIEKPFSPNLLLARVRMAIDTPLNRLERLPAKATRPAKPTRTPGR